jgi:hypothetical protein
MISISKYDSPITQLISRPCSTDSLAFSTETSLGVVLLPLDGNPNKEYAVVANPAGITSITAIKEEFYKNLNQKIKKKCLYFSMIL